VPTYSRQIYLAIEAIEGAVAKERDALALEIVDQLVQRPPVGTPVATGWARSNWIPTLNRPARGIAMRGKAGATPADVSRAGMRQQTAIAELLSRGATQPKAPAYVSNHVIYIGRLADGWSKQNAAGWVERCVEAAVRIRGQAQSYTPIRF